MTVPTYDLDAALAAELPVSVARDAATVGRLDFTRGGELVVRFYLARPDAWTAAGGYGSGGEWRAKRHTAGRSLTGYAGMHAPANGGTRGLSPAGIRRALDALDRQERARPRPRRPRYTCPNCGGKHGYGGSVQEAADGPATLAGDPDAARRFLVHHLAGRE